MSNPSNKLIDSLISHPIYRRLLRSFVVARGARAPSPVAARAAGRCSARRVMLVLGLLSAGGLSAAERYDHVRVLGIDPLENGAYMYGLRCRDGTRRKAIEYWDVESNPPHVLRVCVPVGEELPCKENSDVHAAAEWVCRVSA